MATHQVSPKLEEKSGEHVRPISDALVDDGHNIISEGDTPLSNPDMNAYNDSVPEFNDADSKGEGGLRSANEPDDERNALSADDEENVRSDSVVNVKSEDEASKGASDETDGNIIPNFWRVSVSAFFHYFVFVQLTQTTTAYCKILPIVYTPDHHVLDIFSGIVQAQTTESLLFEGYSCKRLQTLHTY
jgi:hypothetical protein